MSHLGERLTALVDEELGHEERDRALAHLATCAECRAEADTLRRLKSRLRGLEGYAPPTDLLGRLHAMGDASAAKDATDDRGLAGLRGGRDGRPAVGASVGNGVVGASRPERGVRVGRSRGPGDRRPGDGKARRQAAGKKRRRGRYLIAGAATLAVLGVGSASFAAGGDQGRLPPVSPAMQQFAVEHARTTGEVPAQPVGDVRPSEATRP